MNILTIGGATLDLFLDYSGNDFIAITKKNMVSHYLLFQSGEKVEIDHITPLTGGGSTNAATSFRRLGFEVSCFCMIGTDQAGDHVLADLQKEGIDCSSIIRTPLHQTGTSFIIKTPQGDHTLLAHRGANSFLELDKITVEKIKQSSQIYITSLSHQSSQLLTNIVSLAHQHTIPVAINPGISQLTPEGSFALKQSLPFLDTFILNYHEAKTFMMTLIQSNDSYKTALLANAKTCPTSYSDEEPYLIENLIPYQDLYFSIKQFFKEVLKMGPKTVIITNGCNGVYMATDQEIYFHPSMKVKVKNTVGAGDAFGSCFIGSLLLGYSKQDALRNGIMNSAHVLGALGAKTGLLTHDQLQQKVKDVDPKLLQQFPL